MQKNTVSKKLTAISSKLKAGHIGVLPTDTIYGIVASALNRWAVERVYKARKRNPKKPCIILISSVRDLSWFRVRLSAADKKILNQVWPGKVSVILPVSSRSLKYLHRGTGTLAFRLPQSAALQRFLKKTGPLIAPSANPEGEKPAYTIAQAKKYFGDAVDFYADEGTKKSRPSRLIAIQNGKVVVLRK